MRVLFVSRLLSSGCILTISILVCFQLNIFLAILIEGYTAVKSSSVDSSGMPEELSRVISHEASRISRILFGRHSTAFISDDALFQALSAKLQNTPASLSGVLKDYSRIALGTCVQVCFHQNLNHKRVVEVAKREYLKSSKPNSPTSVLACLTPFFALVVVCR